MASFELAVSYQQSPQVHPRTSPEILTPDVDVPVRPPRTGVNAASGVRGMGVEEAVVLEVRIRVANRARGTGGRFSISISGIKWV